MRRFTLARAVVVQTVIALLIVGCQAGEPTSAQPTDAGNSAPPGASSDTSPDAPAIEGTIRVVYNFGSAFYPLVIMQQAELIENAYPGVTVEWHQATGGGDSLTAVAAGQAEIGTAGFPSILIGIDEGLDLKLAGVLVSGPVALVAMDPAIQSLEDFPAEARIAVPGPTTYQAIGLKMASADLLGDADALDDRTVQMAHPDAVAALQNGTIAAHAATPPFLQTHLANGAHVVLDYVELYGKFNCCALMASGLWAAENPELYDAFMEQLEVANDLIRDDPEAAAELIATLPGSERPAEEILVELTEQGQEYGTEVFGFESMAQAMAEQGMIDRAPTLEEIALPGVEGS